MFQNLGFSIIPPTPESFESKSLLISISPQSGNKKPPSNLINVVFPQPFFPIIAMISPGQALKLMLVIISLFHMKTKGYLPIISFYFTHFILQNNFNALVCSMNLYALRIPFAIVQRQINIVVFGIYNV